MRRPLAAVLPLVMALTLLPGLATAQTTPSMAPTGPVPVLTDSPNDVMASAQAQQQEVSAIHSSLDFVGLDVEESSNEFTWILRFSDLKGAQEATSPEGGSYTVTFSHNGRFFRMEIYRGFPALQDGAMSVNLEMRDTPDGEWTYIWGDYNSAVTEDVAADTVTVRMPRPLLNDARGAPPFPGRTLDDVRAVARSSTSGSFITMDQQEYGLPIQVTDDMPAVGAPPVSYAISVGLPQTGSARLFSPEPYRASNGEATTFVYSVKAINVGDKQETFVLQAVGVPQRLSVVLPVPVLVLQPDQVHDVPVLVTVPFAHDHGQQDDFILEMHGEAADSVGRLAMGVTYLAVPQPAGHHDTLYFHTKPSTFELGPIQYHDGYLNTLEDDPSDLGANHFGGGGIGLGPGSFGHWFYPLGPALQMGLDFDVTRTAHIRFVLATTAPYLDVDLMGDLGVGGPDGYTHIFSLPDIPAFNLLPNQPYVVDLDIPINPDADRIAYQPGANMYLGIYLFSKSAYGGNPVTNDGVHIQPGGSLQLPLLEYHDPVDEVLASLGGPGLSPLGAQERFVNPGKAVVFPVSIANPADEDVTYQLEVSGPNLAWASLPAGRVTVPAHATATASVIVRAPPGAADGERADLVLQAFSSKDPAVRGLLRLVTEVDTEATHPDDTAAADDLEKEKSPGLGLPVLGTGIAALAFLARRRRA